MNKKFTPYREDLKQRARELRGDMTAPERRLWFEFLRAFPHPVTRQKPLGNYIVDFYCAKLRLAIEIDGDSHYSRGEQERDTRRDAVLNKLGVRVLRFTNREVMEQFAAVCAGIFAEVEGPQIRPAASPPTPFDKGVPVTGRRS